MADRESPPRPPVRGPGDEGRASARMAVISVATVAWAVTTILPIVFPKVPAVPEMGPAFIAFLGAFIAVPEISKRRRKDE